MSRLKYLNRIVLGAAGERRQRKLARIGVSFQNAPLLRIYFDDNFSYN